LKWPTGSPGPVAELARQLDVPTNRITAILNGRRGITGDTALRLAHFVGTSAEFWLNLQGTGKRDRSDEREK
jgi:addiction module HigA family antidote